MYISGLIPRKIAELDEAVPIELYIRITVLYCTLLLSSFNANTYAPMHGYRYIRHGEGV